MNDESKTMRVSSLLNPGDKLWRYMSIDKLIHLLSRSQLFFSPLKSHLESDPFEGRIPAKSLEALAGILRDPIEETEKAYLQPQTPKNFQ
ncbi:MAG: hypothetical protein GY854_30465 [Deltaproteobacteria bacterium]|nr:hypothetical protein [Deltaproteobacteria bacterium]